MTGQLMDSEDEHKQNVQAEDSSLAVGDIRVGGNTGNISISNVTNIYNALKEEASSKPEEIVEGEPPYMGLRYFDTVDAELFYGREALTGELLARVQKESFLAIVGASGSGKSSVARAGLIPAWIKEYSERGTVHILMPTEHPLESIAASLTRESESVTATSTLMDDMQKDARSLRLYVRKLLSNSGNTNLLLVVDQFEETFTLCKDSTERKAFIENLLSLADEENNSARVVITLRADFYHHCAEYEGLRLMLEKHQAYIGAMTQDELREAITAPAEKNGWDFQPGLVDLILQDVGSEPGALPLLSHALLETWKRRQGRTLTLQGYHEAGGVKKAIAQTAENVYDKLSPAEQAVARNIFLRLTELGEGVQDTRRRVKMEELAQAQEQEAVAKVLKTLTDARLVTTEQDSAEVAHEALIREWGTLRKWLDEDREGLRLHRHLTESAWEWQRRGREGSELYRGARLIQIQEWAKQHSDGLSPLEAEFVQASQNVKRKERLRLTALGSVGVMLLLLAVLGITGQLNRFIYRPLDMEDYWVTIPAGEFSMGSSQKDIEYAQSLCFSCDFSNEQPQHSVYLDEYQIGKYEITNRQYAQCVKAGICGEKSSFAEGRALHPVTNITWDDAVTYCQWVGGHLPTEAEWEKAASWDDKTKTKYIYPWGNEPPTAELLSYNGYIYDTTPVGKYARGASPYGLHGMAGNIWEWVNDSYSDIYYQSSPPSNSLGPENGQVKVLRGGSWLSFDYIVRSAYRYGYYRVSYSSLVGFRCAHSP
jgi:formylglycine-generating enzyme required for sulfatase activity